MASSNASPLRTHAAAAKKVEVDTSEEEAEGNDRILEDCKKAGFTFKAKDPLGHRFDRWLRQISNKEKK